jgi:hypothetical protein
MLPFLLSLQVDSMVRCWVHHSKGVQTYGSLLSTPFQRRSEIFIPLSFLTSFIFVFFFESNSAIYFYSSFLLSFILFSYLSWLSFVFYFCFNFWFLISFFPLELRLLPFILLLIFLFLLLLFFLVNFNFVLSFISFHGSLLSTPFKRRSDSFNIFICYVVCDGSPKPYLP